MCGKWKFVLAAVVLLGVLTSEYTFSAESLAMNTQLGKSKVVTRPLPMKLEGELIRSPFYVSLIEREYNQPTSSPAFAGALPHSPEGVLCRVVAAISAGDADLFSELSDNLELADAQNLLESYRVWLSTADPVVTRSFDLGDMVYFVLKTNHPKLPAVQIVLVKRDGRYRQSFGAVTQPIPSIVTILLKGMQANAEQYAPVTGRAFKNTVALVPVAEGETESPVSLYFDGCPVQYVLSSRAGEPGFGEDLSECDREYERILRFCGNLSSLVAQGNFEEFMAMYGPRSRRSLARNMKDSSVKKALHIQLVEQERRVFYIVGESPVYVLFCAVDLPGHPPSVFEILVRETQGKGLEIANYAYVGTFKRLLMSEALTEKLRGLSEQAD